MIFYNRLDVLDTDVNHCNCISVENLVKCLPFGEVGIYWCEGVGKIDIYLL